MPTLHFPLLRSRLPLHDEAPMKPLLLSLCVLALGILEAKDYEVQENMIRERAEQHAQIYKVLADCLQKDVTLMVGNEAVAECKRVKR